MSKQRRTVHGMMLPLTTASHAAYPLMTIWSQGRVPESAIAQVARPLDGDIRASTRLLQQESSEGARLESRRSLQMRVRWSIQLSTCFVLRDRCEHLELLCSPAKAVKGANPPQPNFFRKIEKHANCKTRKLSRSVIMYLA